LARDVPLPNDQIARPQSGFIRRYGKRGSMGLDAWLRR
jgi:hypothetical protein